MTLVCVSCYVMFLNIAMQLRNMFYKLVPTGAWNFMLFIFSGVLEYWRSNKFIPSTGVTLPLVSYGGSSILQYIDHVCNYSGTLYFKRRRGRES